MSTVRGILKGVFTQSVYSGFGWWLASIHSFPVSNKADCTTALIRNNLWNTARVLHDWFWLRRYLKRLHLTYPVADHLSMPSAHELMILKAQRRTRKTQKIFLVLMSKLMTTWAAAPELRRYVYANFLGCLGICVLNHGRLAGRLQHAQK